LQNLKRPAADLLVSSHEAALSTTVHDTFAQFSVFFQPAEAAVVQQMATLVLCS